VISPPLRSASDRDAIWVGLEDGSLDLVATDHVPDRVGVEKAEAASGVSFDRISNGAPGIETLLALVYSEGVARGRLTLQRMVDLLATTPAARFGLSRKGAIELKKLGTQQAELDQSMSIQGAVLRVSAGGHMTGSHLFHLVSRLRVRQPGSNIHVAKIPSIGPECRHDVYLVWHGLLLAGDSRAA
jgi:hypothetical protein